MRPVETNYVDWFLLHKLNAAFEYLISESSRFLEIDLIASFEANITRQIIFSSTQSQKVCWKRLIWIVKLPVEFRIKNTSRRGRRSYKSISLFHEDKK